MYSQYIKNMKIGDLAEVFIIVDQECTCCFLAMAETLPVCVSRHAQTFLDPLPLLLLRSKREWVDWGSNPGCLCSKGWLVRQKS